MDICPKNAITINDELTSLNAVIDTEKCISCNACHKVCQNNNNVKLNAPVSWNEGWINSADLRAESSSGGVAKALTLAFIKGGGYVCSCVYENGDFTFKIINDEKSADLFTGSKYVKSNPRGIYKQIKGLLKENKVLFIGLPCQVAALKFFVGEGLQENLYTVDLICHGTPSVKILWQFLRENKVDLSAVEKIDFRAKAKFAVAENRRFLVTRGCLDRYTIAFLNMLSYTDNCYECKYARLERTSDITIGDSWGSRIGDNEMKKGVSLILSSTEKGNELLGKSDLVLNEVDLQNAIAHNHQLQSPSVAPKSRTKFFKLIKGGTSVKTAVFRSLPKACAKQKVKAILIKMKIIHAGGGYMISLSKKG